MKILYVILAACLAYFTGGDHPSLVAIILTNVLVMKLIGTDKPIRGALVALLALVVPNALNISNTYFFFTTGIAVVFSLITTITYLIPFVITHYISKKTDFHWAHFFLPVTVLAFEVIMSPLSDGSTWGSEAYACGNLLSFIQITSVTGLAGITFLIYWTSSILYVYWNRRFDFKTEKRPILVFLSVVLMVFVFGEIRLRTPPPTASTIQASAVSPHPDSRKKTESLFLSILNPGTSAQPGLESIKKSMKDSFNALVGQTIEQSEGGAELICWSEAATAFFHSDKDGYLNELSVLARKHDIYIGTSYAVIKDDFIDRLREKKPHTEVHLTLFSPSGTIVWDYLKHNLVPYSEEGNITKGDGRIPVATIKQAIPVSGAICYDMDFPDYLRQAGQSGASLLLAPSNDWKEIKHVHANMGKFRAIENGFALIRPTSNGITLVTDAYGRTLATLDEFRSPGHTVSVPIPISNTTTLYSRYGDWFRWVGFIAFMWILFRRVRRCISDRKKQKITEPE